MTKITMNSELIKSDVAAFGSWSEGLRAIWIDGLAAFSLIADDVGYTGGLPDFYFQFSEAFSNLNTFLTGNDNPNSGGVAALGCFGKTLSYTAVYGDQAAEAAATCVKELEQ